MIPLADDRPNRRFAAVTAGLVAVNVAVFVFQLLLPRWGLTLHTWYYLAGARPFELTHRVDLAPGGFVPWWVTLVSSLFVHGGWLHLLFNMVYLWIFGTTVEDAMTRVRFLAFYLVCGLIATGTQAAVDPGSDIPLIGASGAIAGVLGAYLVLFPRARVVSVIPLVFVYPVVEVPAWILLGIWFALQALLGIAGLHDPAVGVAFFAHVGGFLAGAALALLFVRRPRTGAPRRRRRRAARR